MCIECRMNPCHPSCPNAPEPEAVGTCSCCEGDIEVGDEYAEIGDEYYCVYCLDEMSMKELVELFGGTWRTAGED